MIYDAGSNNPTKKGFGRTDIIVKKEKKDEGHQSHVAYKIRTHKPRSFLVNYINFVAFMKLIHMSYFNY